MYRRAVYALGDDIYTTTELEKILGDEHNKTKEDMLILSVSFSNLSSIFVSAKEYRLARKFDKLSKMFLELGYCDFFSTEREKKQIKANKIINSNKYKKIIGYDVDCKKFCSFFSKIMNDTFENIDLLLDEIPNFTESNSLLFRVGFSGLTTEECVAIVNNFKRACKKKPLMKYQLDDAEKSHTR